MVAIVSGNSFGLLNGSAGVLGQQGMFGNATFGATKEGAYLNVFNGNLTLQDTDGFLANTGLNLAYTRTYNSQGNFGSARGKSWSDGLARLDGAPASGASTVALSALVPFTRAAGDGSVSTFTYDAARGAYVSTDGGGAYQTIRWSTTDAKWHWTGGRDDDKELYESYDANGRLAAAGDAAGVRNRYTYDSAGRLSTITSGSDVTTYTYGVLNAATNTRTTTVTQNLGTASTVRTVYETDNLDRLVRVTTDLTPGNAADALTYAVGYTYDGLSNRIASVTQADGSVMSVTYDGDKVKTITEHDNSGAPDRVTSFGYATVDGNAVSTVTDALGHVTTYTADAQGRLLTVQGPQTDAAPLKLTFSYDAVKNNGDVQSVTDATGRTTWFEYDSHGNNILQRDADGNTITRTFRLLDATNPSRGYTNELLTETVYAVRDPDGAGALKASQPLTSRNVYYTAAGKTHLVRFAITAQGRVTEYTYNAAGERTNEWTYMSKAFDTAAYGADVAVTEAQVTSWMSTSAAASGLINRVDYTYTRGLVTAATHYATAPASTSTATSGAAPVTYTYDNAGNLLTTIDANRTATTSYTYDGLGRVLTRTDPNGTSTYTYLPNATSTSTLEPSGVTTLRVFDSTGRLVSVSQSQSGLSSVTRNVYDAAGRLRMTVAPGDRKTVWLYDDSGRKTAQVGPDGAVTEYVYTSGSGAQPARVVQYATTIAAATLLANGAPRDDLTVAQIRPATTAFDRTSWQRYDALGRVIASVDPEGYLTRYDYDGAGRLVGTIARAEKVAASKLAGGITWDAAADTVSSDDRITRALYNADGLVTAKVDGLGYLTEYVYDAGGQLTDTIAYAVQALKPAVVNSVADLRPSDAGAIRQRMFYDGHGRMIASVDGDGYVTETLYDPNGNVSRRTRYGTPSSQPLAATLTAVKSNISTANPDNRSTTYTYTTLNQVASETVTNESGGATGQTTIYTYDKFGNVLTAVRASGSTVTRTYDKLGRLTSESPAAGVPPTTYTYNSAGQRNTMTDGNGNKTVYIHDDAGRVKLTINGAGEVRQQFYDAFGQVKAVRQYLTRATGVTENSSANDVLAKVLLTGQSAPDTVTQFFYDRDGRLRYTVDGAGGVSETQYTAFGQAAATLRYTSKVAVDMNNSIVTIGAVGGTALSALTALSATTAVGSRYTYDTDGRLTYSVNGAGDTQQNIYDAFDRVTEIRAGDSAQNYGYDKRGNVLAYTDGQRNVVTSTYNAFGQMTVRTRSGLALAGATAAVASVTERSYYNDDGQLVGTIDAAGTLTALTYDADGNVTRRLRFATTLTAAQIASVTAANVFSVVSAQAGKDTDVRYFYAQGRLQSTATSDSADGAGWQITTYKYDGLGNVTGQRTYAKRMTTAPSVANIATFTAATANASASDAVKVTVYDAAGRPEITATLQSLDPASTPPNQGTWSVSTITYDAAGRVLQRRDHATPLSSLDPSTTELRAMAVSDADAVTRFQYDRAGRVAASAVLQKVTTVGEMFSITANEYDGAGNLLKKTQYGTTRAVAAGADLLAAASANAMYDRVTRYAYDAVNRLASTVDGMGTATAFEYDSRGNLVLTRVYATPAAATETLPKTSELDRVTRVAYDLNNRARFEIDATGAVTERRYDAFGNVTAVVRYATPLLSVPAEASADTVAGLVKANAADRVERNVYDENGRLRFAVDAAGYFVEQRYDALGNRLSTLSYATAIAATDSTLVATLLAAATAQANASDVNLRPRVTSYTYDAQGRVLSTKDARLHTESYTYDALGRRVTLTNKLNAIWRYTYDAAGRLLQEENPPVTAYTADNLATTIGASTLAGTSTALVTTYVYDALGNLSSRSEGAKGSTTPRTTSYRYDLAGRQTETWLPPTSVYNDAAAPSAADRTENLVSDLHITVIYDALGNATRNIDAAGKITYKTYDLNGRVAYETDALNYVTRYARNAFGDVTDLTRYADSIAYVDVRTTRGMETSVARRPTTASDRIIHTDYDKLGRAIKVTEPATSLFDSHSTTASAALTASRTTTTRYTPFGEVAERQVYGADASGKAVTEPASTLYYYDARGDKRGQVDIVAMSPNPKGYLSTFDYDAAGRLQRSTEWSTAIGAWNNVESLWTGSSVTAPAATAADRTTIYGYDANGNKTSERRTGNAVDATTTFAYDDLDRLNTTTDASGAKNLTWYDTLGRTTGTARVKAGSAVNPYTEFRLDVYGNVALRIDYANGAPVSTTAAAMPTVTRDAARDRVTATRYDNMGRAIMVTDAENKKVEFSYDALGRVAKQWRGVTWSVINDAVFKDLAYTVTRYDALGRVTDVIQPGNNDLLTYPNGTMFGTMPADTVVHTDYNGFGEAITRTTSSGATVLRTEVTRYDNAGHAWLSNAGDGVYKVTLFDAQGNATVSMVSETAGALAGLTNASEALVRTDIRRTDTRYDLLGHVVDVSSPHANQLTFLHRQPDGTWVKAPYDPASKELDGLVVLGDRAEYTSLAEPAKNLSTYSVRYRVQGTGAWLDAPQRVQRVDGYPVFNTAGLAQGTYEFRITVQPVSGNGYELDGGLLTVAAQASDQKMVQLIKLYSALLGRAPDPQGLNFYLGNFTSGLTLAQTAAQLLDSQEFKDSLTKSGLTALEQILRVNFGMAPTDPAYAGELAAWQARFDLKNVYTADNRGQAILDLMLARDAVLADQALVLKEYLINGGGDKDVAARLRTAAGIDRNAAVQQARQAAAGERLAPQLSRLYVAIFGRAADAGGFAFWRAALEAQSTPPTTILDVARTFLDSDEFKSLQPAGSLTPPQFSEQLARRVYRNLVRRDPSAAELSAATAAMGTTSATRGQWVQQFADTVSGYTGTEAAALTDRTTAFNRMSVSLAYAQMTPPSTDIATLTAIGYALLDEAAGEPNIRIVAEKLKLKIAAQQRAAVDTRLAASSTPLETAQMQVARLYTALLNRAPEHDGYNFWINAIVTKAGTLEGAANDILTKGEGTTIYPASLSNDQFIQALYRNAFGAEIPAANLTIWSAKLAGASRARVAMDLVDGVLTGALPAPQAQRDLFNNKVAVGMTYALQMNGNDSVQARKLLTLVTATDMSAAIDSVYQPTAQLAAAAAVANAKAAADGAKLIADAAYAAQQLSTATQNAAAAEALLASNPMAKPLLAAARLYVGLLNRGGSGTALDVNGIINMATQLANGSTQDQMAQSLLASLEGQNLYAGLDDTAFLTKVYAQTVNRKPDADGLAFWMDVLKKYGRATAAAGVLNGFLEGKFANTDPNSQVHQTSLVSFNTKVGNALNAVATQAAASVKTNTDVLLAAQDAQAKAAAFTTATTAYNQALSNAAGNAALTLSVERLYVGILKRGAAGSIALDHDGLTFWVRGIKQGDTTLAALAQNFIDTEGKNQYGSLNNTAFVNQIYMNVLNRPLGAGDTFWLNELAKGATRGAVAAGIIDSVVNHTYEAASEYDGRAWFEQRVLEANRTLNGASATATAINNAAAAVTNTAKALQDAKTALSNAEAAQTAANNLVATNDANVVAAQQGRNYLASPNRDKLLEALVGFGRSATYASMVPLLADLDAGRTTIQRLVAGWVGPMGDERAFYTTLYRTVLKREPDTDGLNWWVANNTGTDAGTVAYDFYVSCLSELNGNATINYAGKVSAAKSSNNSTATTLANGYNTALQNAQTSIRQKQEQAARDVTAARTALNAAQDAYNNAYSFNEIAKLSKTSLNSIETIQGKAVTVSQAGAAKLRSADTARTLIAQVDPAAVNWTTAQLSAALTPKINAGNAVGPDGQLSVALAGIAGANLALLVNNTNMGNADQLTRNVVKVAQLYTMLFGASRRPTTMELNSALMQLRDGVTLAALADSLIAQTSALSSPANAGYIDLLYRNALGRGADQAGLQFWLGTMTGSTPFTRGKLASELIDSLVVNSLNSDTGLFHANVSQALAAIRTTTTAEVSNPNVRTYIGALALALRDIAGRTDAAAQAAMTPAARYTLEQTQWYVALLGRHPEPSALVNGIAARTAGMTQLQSVQNILASEEIQGKLPSSLSNSDFITRLYAQALGRKPVDDELSNGLAKLAANPVAGRAQLVLDVIAGTYAYTGGDALVQAGRNLLLGEVSAALNTAATGLENYAAAMTQDFVTKLDGALEKVGQRYVDGFRVTLDSTTTAAWYLDTAPDRMTVDRWGNVLSVADVRNANWITYASYDGNNQVLTTTVPATMQGANAVQLTTTNSYDVLGRLQTVTETGSGQTHVTKYEYDSQGVVTKETRADGGYTTYTTDALGQRTASQQFLNASKSVNFKYDYDRLGRLVMRTSDETVVSDWSGKETSSATADTQRFARIVERYTYDELGRRLTTSNGIILRGATAVTEETTTSLRYDLGGNIISSSDGNGFATIRVFDALNQKWKERETTNYGMDSNLVKTRTWQYDGFGRVTMHTDLAGSATINGYNGAGQISVATSSAQTTKGLRYQQVQYTYENGTGLLAEIRDVDYTEQIFKDGKYQLVLVDNAALNQLTKYTYDRAGNRVSEQLWLLNVNSQPVRAMRDQVLGYDARGRLTSISSAVSRADYQVAYQLDAFGNRMNVTTSFVNDMGDKKVITVDYKYDLMNRETNVSGNTNTTYRTPVAVSRQVSAMRMQQDYQDVPDEIPVYWKEFDNKAIASHAVTYDWAGNRATDNTESYSYDALGRLSEIKTGTTVTGYRRYDAAGRVIASRDGNDRRLNDYDGSGRLEWQRTLEGTGNGQRSLVNYRYDGFANLASYKAWAGTATKGQTTTNLYEQLGESRLLTSTTVVNDGSTVTKTSTMEYDVNGYMVAVTGENARTMINDRDGRVLEKIQGYVTTHTLIANGEMIGSSSAAFESFSSVHESVSAAGASASSTGVYVVQSDNEKLTSIAKAIWGDERLWHVIAEANGLTDINEPLKAGQQLVLPAKASTIYNGSETFKPYNAAEVIGSTTPEMALPQPQAAGKKGCGGLGQLIMVVVAVVATIYTAGAASTLLAGGSLGGMTVGATMTAGMSAMGSSFAAAAIGGAVGSIASQAVGIAIGAQDGFNWKGVALSAIGSGVSAGIGGAFGQAASVPAAMGQAALGSVISQGIAVATGLQDHFDWRNVAASAAGAAAGSALNASKGFQSMFGTNTLASRTMSGIASGAAASVVRGGKIDMARIATDAFGNALGSSLAEYIAGGYGAQTPVGRPRTRESIEREQYGGMSLNEVLGGETNYLDMVGYDGADATEAGPLSLAKRVSRSGTSALAENVDDATSDIPKVYINAKKLTPEERIAQIEQIRSTVAILKSYADAGDRERYWNYLASQGVAYGQLALGVVRNDSMNGFVANSYAGLRAAELGVKIDAREWENFGVALMREDAQYRERYASDDSTVHLAIDLPVKDIADYHANQFRAIGLDEKAWTAFTPLSPYLNRGDYDGANQVWAKMMDPNAFVQIGGTVYNEVKSMIKYEMGPQALWVAKVGLITADYMRDPVRAFANYDKNGLFRYTGSSWETTMYGSMSAEVPTTIRLPASAEGELNAERALRLEKLRVTPRNPLDYSVRMNSR